MKRKIIVKLILFNLVLLLTDIMIFSEGFIGLSISDDDTIKQALGITLMVVSVIVFSYYNYRYVMQYLQIKNIYIITELDTTEEFIAALSSYEGKIVFQKEIATVQEQIKRLDKRKETLNNVLYQKFSNNDDLSILNVVSDITNALWKNTKQILNRLSVFDQEEYLKLKNTNIDLSNTVLYEKWQFFQGHISYIQNLIKMNEAALFEFDRLIIEVSQMGDTLSQNDLSKIKDIINAMQKMQINEESDEDMEELYAKYTQGEEGKNAK